MAAFNRCILSIDRCIISICLSIYLSTYLSTYLPIYLSTYLLIYLTTYLPILPIYLSTYLSVYLSLSVSLYTSITNITSITSIRFIISIGSNTSNYLSVSQSVSQSVHLQNLSLIMLSESTPRSSESDESVKFKQIKSINLSINRYQYEIRYLIHSPSLYDNRFGSPSPNHKEG